VRVKGILIKIYEFFVNIKQKSLAIAIYLVKKQTIPPGKDKKNRIKNHHPWLFCLKYIDFACKLLYNKIVRLFAKRSLHFINTISLN